MGGLVSRRAQGIRRKPPPPSLGFIMLSTCPLWTWNTQVLWLLQPSWHELSIRLFQSNSPAGLCHLYFHNCLESWFWRERQSVLPRLTSSLVSRDKRKISSLCQKSSPQQQAWYSLIFPSLNFIFFPTVSNTSEPLLFSQGGGGRPWRNNLLVCCEH